MTNQGSKPQGPQTYLAERLSGPVAPDQIPFRHILQAFRLKWTNALPRRIKWSKRIAWVGSPLIPFIGWFWTTNQEEMPISERRRLNFFASGIRREWWAAHEGDHILETGYVYQILALGRTQPGLIWPDDHPTTRIMRTVCNRLVVANGGNPTAWQVYIANAPEMMRVDHTTNGSILVYSGAIRFQRDEVGLASDLSKAVASRLGMYGAEVFSHKIFSNLLDVSGFNILISAILWRRILPFALSYAGILAAYKWSIRDQTATIVAECDIHALTLMCKAGYNMEREALLPWERNLEGTQQIVRHLELAKIDPAALKIWKTQLLMDKRVLLNLHKHLPEIRAKNPQGKVLIQGLAPLPSEGSPKDAPYVRW